MSSPPEMSRPRPKESGDPHIVRWVFIGLIALLGAAYVGAYLSTSNKVPVGTTVAGVAVGGLTPAAARDRLGDELAGDMVRVLTIRAGGVKDRIEPAVSGLEIDYAGSVAQAGGGRSWSPGRMWDYLTGGDDHPAVVTIDEAKLREALQPLAERVSRPARNGSVVFADGTPEPRAPQEGRRLDMAGSVDAVTGRWPNTAGAVPLPVLAVQPDVGEDEVRRAMNQVANPAVAESVTIVSGGREILLQPSDFSAALRMEAEDGRLRLGLDEEALWRLARPQLGATGRAPRDATVRLDNGRPRVVPARPGISLDRDELVVGFLGALSAEGDARTVEVGTVKARPKVTTAEARSWKIRRVVSSFTTYYPHADYRNVNLGRAAELVTGTVLAPGETFSLNDTVGERTAENGFTKGFIISDGVFKEDFGGGVSQVATTLFNGAFFAGLKDVEHKPHSFYIDRYPVGREATVAWGAVDLRFQNDTPYGVLIQAWIKPSTPSTSGEMHVRMWSTKHWDITAGVSERFNFTSPSTRYISGPSCEPNSGYGGFDINVYRYFRKPGSEELVRRETFKTRYTPSDSVICQ